MKTLVVGNWKMFKTPAETVAFVHALRGLEPDVSHADAVICPPFPALLAAADALGDGPVQLGAQTVHWAETGAFTGEVSASMLAACRVRWVIIGHSERRAMCNETDATVNKKIVAALAQGITPIVAVGETLAEHDAGETQARVVAQVRAAFDGRTTEEIGRCVVAYEPIWAIGTGKVDSPENANATMAAIRGAVDGLTGIRILYGGSVKPDNIGALVAQEHIDGALVGGASLDPASFAALLRNARKGVAA